MEEKIVILDAGSQYGKVIDRRIRELEVGTEILPSSTSAEYLNHPNIKGVIISGGPNSVYDSDAPRFTDNIFETVKKPILGICYGMQLLCKTYNGTVEKGTIREDGQDCINVDTSALLFNGLDTKQNVLLTHGDSITDAGSALQVTARSSLNIIAGVQHKTKPLYGLQFHPEVELTENGKAILKNFLVACKCSFSYSMDDREKRAVDDIKQLTAKGEKVLCLVSGGVDSTVCAALLLKALGPDRIICIHVDHGLMRLNESKYVVSSLEAIGVKVHLVDASLDFSSATTEILSKDGSSSTTSLPLSQVIEPETKRNIIGDTFIAVVNKVTKELQLEKESLLLAQGTLRPDLIESGSAHASTKADAIKTHHNDTSVVRALRDAGKIIEPLKDYHKDEVRELGYRLGLPQALVARQPFPGPGLGIRVLCSDGHIPAGIDIPNTELTLTTICSPKNTFLPQHLQDFLASTSLQVCVLPVRTVGVQGDGRTYAYAASLSLERHPTASEWPFLMELAKQIPKVAQNINRVVYTFGKHNGRSPTAITPTTLLPSVLNMLRAADAAVNDILTKHNLIKKLSQVPVILIPLSMENDGKRSVVIRTILTNDFMTGVPALPGTECMPLAALEEIITSVSQLPFFSRVMYDLTGKPPGTTEWE